MLGRNVQWTSTWFSGTTWMVYIALIWVVAGSGRLSAQTDFYDLGSIREIRIYFEEANWDHILDSLYVDGEEERLEGVVEIDGTRLEGVGIRYKGFSSVSVNRRKNPFNIKLDYTDPDQHYQQINKLKLSNVIQDPSFVREVLSYEIGRKYMPASRANFANVYINDTLWGLYTNVEAVNKDFLDLHYDSRRNAFFKCNPEALDLNGENANLSNSPGTDVAQYHPLYELKSDDGWDRLYHLIDTLNNVPDSLHRVLNVDQTLWMHAFNYALINFDSYVGYAQNYYLYVDETGRFNPIIWDLNMSFGSFRFTDASDNFAGLTVPGCQTVDPLQHFNSVSVYPRPLIRNVMANSTYQRMYLAHLRTIVEENFANGEYYARAEAIQNDISAAVFADTNKFYSDADFTDNLDSTVTDLIEYPGIRDLIEGRTAYLQSYPGMTGAPTLSNAAHSPQSPLVGDDVTITVDHADAGEVWLAWRNGSRSAFQFVQMFDDGQHGDGGANDGTSGFRLTEIGNNVQYYVYAQNDSAGRFLPARAAYEYYAIQPQIGFQDLAINEVMAVNNFTATDPAGQYDDWIELFNNTDFPISTGGMYLSDSAGHLTKWALPDVILPSRGFQIVWADDDTTQSGLHANFKLDGEGDRLYLAYADGTVIDSVVFGRQNFIASYGRDPNGRGAFTEMLPTFDIWNKLTDDEFLTDDLFVFPSPTTADGINYVKVNGEGDFVLSLYSAEGRRVWHDLVLEAGALDRLPTESLRPGIYILKAQQGDTVLTRKFIIHR